MLTPEQAAELRELANDAVTEATIAVRSGGSATERGSTALEAWTALSTWIDAHTRQ